VIAISRFWSPPIVSVIVLVLGAALAGGVVHRARMGRTAKAAPPPKPAAA